MDVARVVRRLSDPAERGPGTSAGERSARERTEEHAGRDPTGPPPRLGPADRERLRRLARELAPELATLRGDRRGNRSDLHHLGVRLAGGATYRTQTHRDPLRPELDGRFSADRLLERAFLEMSGQLGPIAGGFRGGRDGIFLSDAQYPEGRVVPEKNAPILDELGYRTEEAYLELQTEYASLFFGRMYRTWGPPGVEGLVRSDYAYSEEELTYRVGTDRIFLTGSLASLPDFRADTARYLSTHRLEARPWESLVVAVTEAVIQGGPSEPLVWSLVNPVGIWHNAREDDDPPKNVVGSLDAWWKPTAGLTLYGSWLLDATKKSSRNTVCCSQGGVVGIELPRLLDGWLLRGRAAAIQSLAYTGLFPWEEWSLEGVGLGWDKSDLYLLTVEADGLLPGGLRLRPRLDLQVDGEGDLRMPRPPPEVIDTLSNILLGEPETTFRPSLSGRWRPEFEAPVRLDVEWNLGVNFIRDYRHRPGDDRTEVVGWVRVLVETPRWLFRFED